MCVCVCVCVCVYAETRGELKPSACVAKDTALQPSSTDRSNVGERNTVKSKVSKTVRSATEPTRGHYDRLGYDAQTGKLQVPVA